MVPAVDVIELPDVSPFRGLIHFQNTAEKSTALQPYATCTQFGPSYFSFVLTLRGVDTQGAQESYAAPIRKIRNSIRRDFSVIYT